MKQEQENELIADCIINLAYYYIFGASLLLYRFERTFSSIGLAEQGKTKMMLNRAKDQIASAIKILDTFDDAFIKASQGLPEKFDAYHSVTNELIALNLLYLGHSYIKPEDSAEVFNMMKAHGEAAPALDELSDFFLKKSLNDGE